MTLKDIFNSSDFSLAQFPQYMIRQLEAKITTRNQKEKEVPYVNCIVRNKEIKLTPEEAVRQLFTQRLIEEYGYPVERIVFEHEVHFGREVKRADIVVFEDDARLHPYIVVETKRPKEKEGKDQLASYCKSLGASIAVLCNGAEIEEFFLNKENPKNRTQHLEKLTYLPKATQTLSDVLNVKFTLKNLIIEDELKKKTLKRIIQDFEDVVLANNGVDSFEEIFKFIFTKLYDEFLSSDDADTIAILQNNAHQDIKEIDGSDFRALEFRNTGTDTNVKDRLSNLFERAKKKWHGIFEDSDTFRLSASDMKICVSYLQDVKLFNSNLEVVDDAFEYLVQKSQKGEKGQYFTPRYVIDMCVRMLNPKEDEKMIDTAAGSCGFPMHTIMHVWGKMNPDAPNLFTTRKRTQRELDYVRDNVFAIDFDLKTVRVGRTLNLIAGDGHTNVLLLNSLDYDTWQETSQDKEWLKTYNEGFRRLEALQEEGSKDYSHFGFDIVMANPPFAGDITKDTILAKYPAMRMKDGKKAQTKIGRDILFIERNFNFLKPGGRMAIVLPQGRFNNSSDRYIRDYIAERCRILAVVGLHGNTFKPHTGTKTSVLFVQKWDDELCPRCEDYPIFFATMQEPGKDNSGEKIYERENGDYRLDSHGHLIVRHDLFNHDGLTRDGIAEAFAEFAKKERLSFFL